MYFARPVAALLVCVLCMFSCSPAATIERPPNVVLIVVDDLRPALGSYGDRKARTPNIDRLADESIVFDRAYAQQALCAPSRNSLLTSRRPDTLQLYDFVGFWRTSVGNFTTLPQHLRRFGYRTRSFGKVFHPGSSSNGSDDYPLSWSEPAYHSPAEAFENAPVCNDGRTPIGRRNVVCPVSVPDQPLGTLPDIDTVDEALRFLQRSSPGPKFAAVGLHRPHIPFRFPVRFLQSHQPLEKFARPTFAYVPHDLPAVAFNPYADIRWRDDARLANISWPFGPVPEQFGMRMRQAYYASVSYADELIGRLADAVRKRNDTLLVLIGDHGWSLGEHAEWAKYSCFEVAVRVPFLVRPLGGRNAAMRGRIDGPVELLDVFPTIVELLGGKVAQLPRCPLRSETEIDCTEGRSLVPMMLGSNRHDDAVAFSQYPRPASYPQVNSDRPMLLDIRVMGYTMRTRRFRYTAWIGFETQPTCCRRNWNRLLAEELYDHRLDADENGNLADRPELARVRNALRRRLRRKFPSGNVRQMGR